MDSTNQNIMRIPIDLNMMKNIGLAKDPGNLLSEVLEEKDMIDDHMGRAINQDAEKDNAQWAAVILDDSLSEARIGKARAKDLPRMVTSSATTVRCTQPFPRQVHETEHHMIMTVLRALFLHQSRMATIIGSSRDTRPEKRTS